MDIISGSRRARGERFLSYCDTVNDETNIANQLSHQFQYYDWLALKMSTCCQIHMDWRLHGLLYGLLIAIGVAGGFYLATALQRQIEALIGAAVVIGFLTWLGSGADLLGLLRDWYKDKREAERTPTIDYSGIFRTDQRVEIRGEKYTDTTYLLRVELVKGEGMVNNCHAAVTVQQTSLAHASLMWTTPLSYQTSISRAKPEHLELFRLRQYDGDAKPKHFVFYSGMHERDQMQSYDIVENVLSVTLGSENGNIPKPFVKTIQNIMNEANVVAT